MQELGAMICLYPHRLGANSTPEYVIPAVGSALPIDAKEAIYIVFQEMGKKDLSSLTVKNYCR